MAESGTTQLRNDSSVPPTRFAGLRGGPAKPAVSAMPRGDLTAIGAEQVQQVVREVWPGGPDAVRRRARGARFLLEHLAGFPGPAWQQRWEASGLNERGRPVTAVRGKQAERDEICVGTAYRLAGPISTTPCCPRSAARPASPNPTPAEH